MSDVELPSVNSKKLAILGWSIAAIPVVVSALQAVARITGTKVGGWPIIGSVADVVHSVEIFRLMSLAFDSSEPVVLILFVLISISMVLVGISLFRPETTLLNYSDSFHRSVSLVSAVVFGILYASMYADLWQESLTLQQRSVLVLFPLSTFGGIFIAYWAQPQTNAYRLLDQAEREVKAELEIFSERAESLTTNLRKLPKPFDTDLDAEGIPESRRKRAFEDVLDQIEDHRDRSITASKREVIAKELYDEDVRGLDGETEYEDVETNIRAEIADQYRNQYEEFVVRSETFDRRYEIINRDSYRSFEVDTSLQSNWQTINVNALEDVADEIRRDDEPIEDVVTVLRATQAHVEEVREDLRSEEEEFVEIVNDARGYLDTVTDRINDLPGDVGTRLREIYQMGHIEKYHTMGMIEAGYGVSTTDDGKLDKAIDAHHECQFSDALHTAEEAREMAQHLDEVTRFVELIVDASEDGVTGVEIPDLSHVTYDFFDRSLIENELGTRMQGVRLKCNWEDDVITLDYIDDENRSTDSVTTTSGDESDDEIPASRVNRGVEFVLNGIKTDEIGEREEDRVAVRRSNLPGIYDAEEIVEATANHLGNQQDLIREVEQESLPDHLEFEIDPDREFRPVIEETSERYEDRNKHTNY